MRERERLARDWQSREGIAELIGLAQATAPTVVLAPIRWGESLVSQGTGVGRGSVGGHDGGARGRGPVRLAPWEVTPGALSGHYELPRVCYSASRWWLSLWLGVMVLALSGAIARHFISANGVLVAVVIWTPGFATRVVPLVISFFDRPFAVTPRQERGLARLCVVVAVPVYNEDPALLDRCLWALANQYRPPDVVHVVEDGPSAGYTALRDHWERQECGTRFQWTQTPENGGKKAAQSVVFGSHPEADIFVTVDSDTALEYRAIEEGLKPFADPQNMSVAGVEENFNKKVNWLTRSVAARNTYYQLTTWGAQSVLGDLLVNRGTFALYRAWVIRDVIPAYTRETFLGHRIKLGDDAALTLFSQAHGRTVQQLSAFSLPMHPENLSHHFRQWTRWARGAVIRNCWRIRYLPMRSYGFWWTVLFWYMILMSGAAPVVIAATWPHSEDVLVFAGTAIICWTFLAGFRILCVHRSDDSPLTRAASLLLYPAGILWATVVLRWVRLYGASTFLKQRWTTRQSGTEDLLLPELEPAAVSLELEGAL